MSTIYGCSTHDFKSKSKMGLQLHMNGTYNCNLTIGKENEMPTNNEQDALDRESLAHIVTELRVRYAARLDRLTNRYTNSTSFEDLGIGLQDLLEYVLKLEDAISPTRTDIKLESYRD